ncbi:MAG: serine protease, partial [Alphaproteobacteria bacterium]|nr:serine protease [Alphaproteobacteria bacterium]
MSDSDWSVPGSVQPKPADYAFDLERALTAVVGLRASVPEDAFSAETLGTERAGNGVVIRADGIVLTIGYLVTEAETVYLSLADGRAVQGHVLAYDQETGFGLVQALGRLGLPALPLGNSGAVAAGERVVLAGAGGRTKSVAARIVAKQEFAGYWEYLLEEAIFTAPAHPNWGGAALIGPAGELLGIGSLQLQQSREGGPGSHINMVVPIDALKPVFDDLMTIGRPNRPPRPWLGVFSAEISGKVVVVGLSSHGPAQKADLRSGDILLAVAGGEVEDLADLYRRIWALGRAGVDVPLTIHRDGRTFDLVVPSADRRRFLKGP